MVRVHLPDINQLLNFPDLYRYSYATTYRSMLDDLAQIRGLLANNPRKEGVIPIGIADFAPKFGQDGWNTQAPALAASGLMTADLASQAMRVSLDDGKQAIKYACYGELNRPSYSSLMINPDFEAADIETWGQSPSYLAFELATELQGGIPLMMTELEGPRISVSKEGKLQGIGNVPLVSMFATGDPAEGVAWILIVNRDMERPVRCEISLDMAGLAAPELSLRQLEFKSLLSTNLAGESVKAPLPTPGSKRTVVADDFAVTVDRAGVALVILEAMEVD